MAANPFSLLAKTIVAPAATRLTFERPLRVIAVLLSAETKQNFVNQRDPDGNPWLPLRKPAKRRGKNPKILRDTGILMASVTAMQAKGGIQEITSHSLVFGSNIFYGVFHQEGTKRMPARPWVGLNARINDKIDRIIADFAAGAVVS